MFFSITVINQEIKSNSNEDSVAIGEELLEEHPDNKYYKMMTSVLTDYQNSQKIIRVLGIFGLTSFLTATYLWFSWPKSIQDTTSSETASSVSTNTYSSSNSQSRRTYARDRNSYRNRSRRDERV